MMADSDVILSMDMDTTDAKKTAEELQKEIEQIFSARGHRESQALANIEEGIRGSCDQAVKLRKELDGLATDIANTENYTKFQHQIEETESTLEAMQVKLQQARQSAANLTGAPASIKMIPDIQKEIDITQKAIEESQQYGYSTEALEKKLSLLTNYQDSYNQKLEATSVTYNGQLMTYSQLQDMYDKTATSMQVLKNAQDQLNFKQGQMSATEATTFANTLKRQYGDLDTQLGKVNTQIQQQLVLYTTTSDREEAMLQLQRQQGALEEEMALKRAEIEYDINQQREEARKQIEAQMQLQKQAAEEERALKMDVAKKQWEMAVAEQERQAALQSQHQQELAIQRQIREEAALAAEQEKKARLEAIQANTAFIALTTGVNSIARLIPGLNASLITGAISAGKAITKITELTTATVMAGLNKIKTAVIQVFKWIAANPAIAAGIALVAASLVLFSKIKEEVEKAVKQTEELLQLAGEGLSYLGSKALNLLKTLTTGFVQLGNLLPKTIINIISSLANKLKSLKSYIQESINEMAKWNNGNNAINKSLSNITSSLAYLKASIAAAVAPVITYVEPMLTRLIDMLARVFEIIGMIIAKITGATTFQRAIRKQKDYADSLKQTNGQLAAFDKLNVLNSNDSETVDFELVGLEDVELPSWLDDFEQLAKDLSKKINKFLKGINWDTVKDKAKEVAEAIAGFFNGLDIGKELGRSLGEVVNTLTTFINTFLARFKPKEFGTKIRDFIISAITTIQWKDVGDVFSGALNTLAGIIIGLLAPDGEGKDLGTRIGEAFSDFISGALGDIDWELQRQAMTSVATNLANFLNTIFTEENFTTVATTLAGVLNTLFTGMDVFADQAKWTEWGTNVAKGIMKLFAPVEEGGIDFKKAGEAFGKMVEGILNMFLAAVTELTKPDNLEKVITKIKDFFEAVPWTRIGETAVKVSKDLRTAFGVIWNQLQEDGTFDDLLKLIVQFLNEKDNWETAFKQFKADIAAGVIRAKVGSTFDQVISVLATSLANMSDIFGYETTEWQIYVEDAINNIIDLINGFFETLRDWGNSDIIETLFGSAFAKALTLAPKLEHVSIVSKEAKNARNRLGSAGTMTYDIGKYHDMLDYAYGKVAPTPTLPYAYASPTGEATATSKEKETENSFIDALSKFTANIIFEVQGDPNNIFKVVRKEATVYKNQTGISAFD